MDYHTLPRRQLQALCKKHGIPANAANSDMADALTALLKPKPQLHVDSSKQTEKRTTRSRETTLSETVSKSKDVEEESNMKLPKASTTHKILEEESNRKPQRATRGRGSACVVLEVHTSSALKKEKTPANGETESNSAAKQQEIKKVSTRNGASKHSNTEMSTNAEETVDSKTMSPKSDKKKEKTRGIVLRRGRVKVGSPRNLSNSPESGMNIKGVAVTTEEETIGMTSSQSCLVDAKKTRKKKRSVTFSDVLEVNTGFVEHPSRGVKETIAEIPQGPEPNLPKNKNSACIAERVVVTRKASRNVSSKDCIQDTIAAQEIDPQKSSKKPVAKVSKAEGLHTYDANIEIGRKKSVRCKKISSSVGEAAVKENEEVKVADGFIEGAHIEEVPCTRRSRRLTIVPIDVKSNQDMQLTTEKLKGQAKDQHEGNSIAPKKTEGDLPAETSRRSGRKTLATLELNHVQSNVVSGSEQMEKRVSKAKDTQSKGYALELKDEALKAHQKHSEIKACKSTPVTIEGEAQPMKTKEARSGKNLRGSRQKGLGASTYQHITPTEEVLNEMGCQNIGTTEIEKNVDTIESEKADNQSPLSTIFSGPCSLQEVSKDAKVEIETVETISVMPRSTRKTFKVSTHPDNGTAVSQEPAFNNDEAVGKNFHQDSEDLDVIAQAYIEQSQEILVLKNTNEPRIENPVNNTPVNDDINCGGFLSPLHVVKGKRQNPINSEDANPISCTEEFEYITSTIDVRSSSTTATHCATCDSETANSSPLVEKLDTADVKCHEFTEDTSSPDSSECVQQGHIEKDHDVFGQKSQAMGEMVTWGSETANSSQLVEKLDVVHEFTEDPPSATSSDYVQQGHEFTIEKDHDVLEQESHAMDEMATIISLTEDISKKSRSGSPLSIMIQDNGSPDGNHHMEGTDFENSVDIHTGEGITASSPAAIVESTFEHQISIDITTAEQESRTPKVHLLPSDKEKIASTCGGAADLVEQQPNQPVDLNLCEEDAVDKEDIQGDLQKEQLQDMNEEVPSDGVKMVQDVDDHLGKSSPLSPSCSAEPGIALPRESACKTKQRGTRSIYKSARKAKFSVPWENRSLEENTAPYSNEENSFISLDQVEKDGGIWGLNSHEMSSDEVDPSSSEEEESSAETEETLADMEVCNFNTEVLISNTEGDYSSSEDDTTSDSEEDTMFDSEDDLSEMEGELLSGEECYESEELDTTEEELSESEGDSGDDFEEYEASSVSQSVKNSESFDAAIYTTHGLEDQQVEIIYPSKLYLPNDGIIQPVTNHLTLVNSTNGCAPDLDPTDIDEKIGEQHEELQRTLSPHAATGIQENVDVHMSYSDSTAMQRVQSTTDSSCQDSDTLTSLSSLFVTPPSKVEDVKCSLAPPSIGILESNIFQQSRTLEIESNHLLKSGQEESMQLCLPCELLHGNVIAEQHTMDRAEHGIKLCESVEKEPDIDGQMVELIETCSVEISLAGPAVVDCFMASPMLNNVQNSQLLESNSKNASISGKENEKIHIDASETPCIGPCELILEGNRAEMGDPEIIEDGLEEDELGNVEVKNDCENVGSPIGIAPTAQSGSEDLRELLDLGEGTATSSKLTEELIITEVATLGSSALAVKDNLNESETAIEQGLQVHYFNVDDFPQKQNNEHALAFDTAYSSIRTTDCVVSLESAKELELNMVSADDKIHLFSSDTSCNLLEEGERLHLLQCEQHLMPSDASKQSKTEATAEGPVEVIQPQSNAESLVSQVMASNTFEADCCSTPKCSNDSGIAHVFNHESLDEVAQNLYCVEIECEQALTPSDASELSKTEAIGEGPEVLQSESNAESLVSQVMQKAMFNHESLDEVAQTLHCVEIESVNAQAEEIYEKPLDKSQYSEKSNEDKETAEAQSMKQIDLTLLSIRRLRQMCKENEMSAKKKPENETPARKPSNLWMSATKQPSTSMHPRDLPSANKRSALQALSSNVKATPSAALQTPTAKVLQKPRNLMGTYDGNEGTGKHLVTPSPKAPMSSKRDFARSHHR